MPARPKDGSQLDLIVDLSNVCKDASFGRRGAAWLGAFDLVVAAWEGQFKPNPRVLGVADNSLLPALSTEDKRRFKDLERDGLVEHAPHADVPILEHAEATSAAVVTRDNFKDYRKRFPWIGTDSDRFYDWTMESNSRLELTVRDMNTYTSFEVSRAADLAELKGQYGLSSDRLEEALQYRWSCSSAGCLSNKLPASLRPLPDWRNGAFVCPSCGSAAVRGEFRAAAIEIKVRSTAGPELRRVVEAGGIGVVVGRGEADIDVTPIAGDAAQKVSSAHARIECDGDAWYVTDLESTNGTYVADWDGQGQRRKEWKRIEAGVRQHLNARSAVSLSDAVRIDRSGKVSVRS